MFSTRDVFPLSLALFASLLTVSAQGDPVKVFISVDMEGIGGIGTSQMTRGGGKDYELGRRLMTEEVNAVVSAIMARGPAEIVVNDSHGDMRNLYHLDLDPRVTYIQGNIKPLGMVQGLDGSFDAVVFLGYHARAGTKGGFLAHTGSGSVKGLWLNDLEVGEGGLNAAFAGSHGVPVVLAAGDMTFTREISGRISPLTVATKEAIGANSCRLIHPELIRKELGDKIVQALDGLSGFKPMKVEPPISIRVRFATTSRADVLQAIPGMSREDGFTVRYTAQDMDQAYQLIRLMYKYVRVD